MVSCLVKLTCSRVLEIKSETNLTTSRIEPRALPKKELTTEEKQAIEIEKLKRELERERMVNEVLKKNLEIRQKTEKDSRLLGKKINTKR